MLLNYITVSNSSTPILRNASGDVNVHQHGDIKDLGSLYRHSPECQGVSAKLEPIVVEMNHIRVQNGNYRINCYTDSYSTSLLWQVWSGIASSFHFN